MVSRNAEPVRKIVSWDYYRPSERQLGGGQGKEKAIAGSKPRQLSLSNQCVRYVR